MMKFHLCLLKFSCLFVGKGAAPGCYGCALGPAQRWEKTSHGHLLLLLLFILLLIRSALFIPSWALPSVCFSPSLSHSLPVCCHSLSIPAPVLACSPLAAPLPLYPKAQLQEAVEAMREELKGWQHQFTSVEQRLHVQQRENGDLQQTADALKEAAMELQQWQVVWRGSQGKGAGCAGDHSSWGICYSFWLVCRIFVGLRLWQPFVLVRADTRTLIYPPPPLPS